MPYITKDMKKLLDDRFKLDEAPTDLKAGEMNYVITTILKANKPKSYEDYNRQVGVLICCLLELYRRKIAPYEDKKIAENGDVY